MTRNNATTYRSRLFPKSVSVTAQEIRRFIAANGSATRAQLADHFSINDSTSRSYNSLGGLISTMYFGWDGRRRSSAAKQLTRTGKRGSYAYRLNANGRRLLSSK